MASPITMGGPNGGWPIAASSQQQMTMPPSEAEEMGVQVRQMGLKVHYTFDKDGRVNCLARWPQTLQVQAIPIDEHNWIGVVDLRVCVQAVAQCSPEIVGRNDRDYTVYAFDYSEPETPLVGQGMLSLALQAAPAAAFPLDENAKMVTGRVTKNMLAIFGKGVRETLEVKLRLNEVPRMVHADTNNNGQDAFQNQPKGAPTPTDSAEWSSFLQSNPTLGRSASVSMMHSPSLVPIRPDMQNFQQPMTIPSPMPMPADAVRSMSRPASRPGSRPGSRQSSMPPSMAMKSGPPLLAPKPSGFTGAGSPPNDETLGASTPPAEISQPVPRPSRPSSRARSRQPTGRPRGRPRKRPPVDGNTSAAEEQPTDADADDGPKRKRAKTIKADYPTKASLDMAPESLRVAASTSGALRSLRPVLAGSSAADANTTPGSHLQEIPRAPTPVPQGAPPSQNHARKMMAHKARRESLAGFDTSAFQDHMFSRGGDARSPTDSVAPSPENYTPEDSPADIGSSPPVPRSATYMPQSSPIPSSPILPPMPRPQPDSGFMSGGMDDLFDDDECMNDAGTGVPPTPLDLAAPTPTASQQQPPPAAEAVMTAPTPTSAPTPTADITTSTNTSQTSRMANSTTARKNSSRSTEQYSFMAINPGPPELLPVTSIYNPPQQKPRPAKLQRTASSAGIRAATATLKRSNSEPAQPPQLDETQTQPSQPPRQQMQLSQQQQLQPQPLALPSETADMSGPNPTEMHPATQADSTVATPAPVTQAMAIDSQSLNIDVDINELAKLIGGDNHTLHMPAAQMEDMQSPQSQLPLPQFPPPQLNRPSFTGGLKLPSSSRSTVPASDPPPMPPLTLPALPQPPTAFSEAACPPSDMEPSNERSNKNLVRKAAIRERLQKAIESGEMPPFCQNCGAIETPTWRKMWTQDHDGEPGYHEYSEKPGHVTAIDILERNDEGKPIKYRLVKKALGPTDNGRLWKEMLLCNPCGIWLGKFKSHRPSDRWDKDASRLNQPRRKRARSKKSNNSKSDAPLPPTSEAYFTTDPIGPAEFDDLSIISASTNIAMLTEPASMAQMVDQIANGMAPSGDFDIMFPLAAPATVTAASDDKEQNTFFQAGSNRGPASGGGGGDDGDSGRRRTLGSTHSRGSGTANSPIALDDHFGSTRRLLFPSPRKDGVPKVLGELSVNIVASAPSNLRVSNNNDDNDKNDKNGSTETKDNAKGVEASPTQVKKPTASAACDQHDDMADLFGTPPSGNMRPSTPPPKSGCNNPFAVDGSGANEPFKTPTRPTPNHRPITRSISKSIRSGVSCPKSPTEQLMLLQRTPSKTPRSAAHTSTGRRRSVVASTPGRQSLHGPFHLEGLPFDSPFTSTLNQLLSEANEFTTGSPSHGLTDIDLASLSNLESDGLTMGLHSSANIDFGSYLDTDLTLPSSSSPLLGRRTGAGRNGKLQQVTFGEAMTLKASESMWTDLSETIQADEV